MCAPCPHVPPPGSRTDDLDETGYGRGREVKSRRPRNQVGLRRTIVVFAESGRRCLPVHLCTSHRVGPTPGVKTSPSSLRLCRTLHLLGTFAPWLPSLGPRSPTGGTLRQAYVPCLLRSGAPVLHLSTYVPDPAPLAPHRRAPTPQGCPSLLLRNLALPPPSTCCDTTSFVASPRVKSHQLNTIYSKWLPGNSRN